MGRFIQEEKEREGMCWMVYSLDAHHNQIRARVESRAETSTKTSYVSVRDAGQQVLISTNQDSYGDLQGIVNKT